MCRAVKPVLMLAISCSGAREAEQGVPPAERRVGSRTHRCPQRATAHARALRVSFKFSSMKVQQTLAQTWKRRRDSDHAEAKRLIEERGVGLLAVPDELLDIILGYSDLSTRLAAVHGGTETGQNILRGSR